MSCRKFSAQIHEELVDKVDEMERKHQRRSANAEAYQEHQRRMSEHGKDGKLHLTYKQRRSKELMQGELKRKVTLRFC